MKPVIRGNVLHVDFATARLLRDRPWMRDFLEINELVSGIKFTIDKMPKRGRGLFRETRELLARVKPTKQLVQEADGVSKEATRHLKLLKTEADDAEQDL